MDQFLPVRSRSVVDSVLHQIVDRIHSGQLREGDTLPSERALAEQMEVSRPTVRQALDRLSGAGVLRNGTGRSGQAKVTSIWIPDELFSAPADAPDADEVFRLLEARRTLEPRVAQLAALRATAKHYADMQHSIDLLRTHRDDLVKASQAEFRFHRAMWSAADNPYLERTLINLMRRLEAVHDMMLRTPDDYAVGVTLHEETLAALQHGEPEQIESVMLRHLGHFESIIEDVYGRRVVRQPPDFLTRAAGRSGHNVVQVGETPPAE
ncbi:FadR/GntR family transcriptional regulator [Streptomyces sp. 303MFCol5.2]|uniref:FadR/GntR family transcriptional regulator n=1 Tax=Streptomyces sp. 303MFCol5.2 TaxID=1172181 RepID=UPI0003765107|nr:FCD domain-containing protein [Streptomyces sp. 303MFCol5.2]